MDIENILKQVQSGAMSVEEAAGHIKYKPMEDIGYATIDYHRELRSGCPEVIYCASKTPGQAAGIARNMRENGVENILATRAPREVYDAVRAACPEAVYHEAARLIVIETNPFPRNKGRILVATGGTSDMPVAEEAALTAEFLGNRVDRLYDVGVAGLHRLLMRLDALKSAQVLIVAAGMEGALASVVGGLTDKPVIAVPTSVGYGASFGGVAALLAMLNSCASGVGVVNIDNGFGAGFLAHTINRLGGYDSRQKGEMITNA